MSQVREALNPGVLEGDLLQSGDDPHVQTFPADGGGGGGRQRQASTHNNYSEDEGIEASKDEEEEGPVGAGHDSDPPIENQNPEDGDGSSEEIKQYVEDEDAGTGESIEGNKKKSQVHHRKRKKSIHNNDGSYIPPYKKNRFRRQVSVLPSKFLLGGNIRDPLNLASLADAKVNAEMNKATPKSSPMAMSTQQRQAQVPVFIPKNPDDPLGLAVPTDNPNDIIVGVQANKQKKNRHRRRHGRRRTDSECSASTDMLDDEEDDANADGAGVKAKVERKRTISDTGGTSFEASEKDDSVGKRDAQQLRAPSVPKQVAPAVATQPERENKSKETLPSSKKEVKEDANSSKVAAAPPVKRSRSTSKSEELNKTSTVEKKEEVVITVSKEKCEESSTKSDGVDVNGTKDATKPVNETANEEPQHQAGVYPCKSSEYVPLSSSYAPSPYIFDTMNPEEAFEVKPFESPSLTNYCCNAATPSHLMEPFSPPPRPEIPHFQKRMQMMSSHPHRHSEMSLQRAVFQRPFYRRRFRHKSDPIVSPVIPQPGCRRNHNHHHHNHRHKKNEKQGSLNTSNTSSNSNHSISKKGNISKGKQGNQQNEIKNFRPKDEIYQFGNYKQYYGYRTTPDGDDPRLWIFKKDWFRDKDVLDIGCNIGHVTLSIARDFEARRVHGIDIDNNLITTARKNIKHYMIHDPSDKNIVFPHSLPMIYGAMQPPSRVGTSPQKFPFNVMFSQENYVMSNDTLLDSVKPEYDVIICLSVTKWIHLNFGDDGLKRFFRRIYHHLRKGGKLILEPQEWSSYYRKRKLTAKISENYKNLQFLPDNFPEFLVHEVGFTFIQRLGTLHHSKGFQRPILIFTKESKGDSPMSDNNPTPDNTEMTTSEKH